MGSRIDKRFLVPTLFWLIVFLPATVLAHPRTAGRRVAENILSRNFGSGYANVCSQYGVAIFAQASGQTDLLSGVISAYQPYLDGEASYNTSPHVDHNVFGIVGFELYRQTGNADYLVISKHLADQEFETLNADGLSWLTRYWVDDMYMIGSLQAQAYKALGEPNYAENGSRQLLGYIEDVIDLQRPNGLFYHNLSAPFHWGRGNGWAAAAMTETLLAMPTDHPRRAQLLAAYQRMMDALVLYQDADGIWYQIIDLPNDPDNWVESSCTGMFVFALVTGYDQGWLTDPKYIEAGIRGWVALEGYIREDGQVTEVCVGTNLGSTVDYYFNRSRSIGDFHGQAAAMWAATAMVRYLGDTPLSDFNYDKSVNLVDYAIFAPHFGDGIEPVPATDPGPPAVWYPLDETGGTVAIDASPGGTQDGTVSGAVFQPTAGHDNGALLFTQATDYLQAPTNWMNVDTGTVSLWFKLSASQTRDTRYLFGHTSSSSSFVDRIQIYMDGYDNGLEIGLGDNHGLAEFATVQNELWYHVGVTWDHGEYRAYLNGKLKATGTYSGLSNLASAVEIGNNGRQYQGFEGLIDDVRLDNRALNESEMAYLAGLTHIIVPLPGESVFCDFNSDSLIDIDDLLTIADGWLWVP